MAFQKKSAAPPAAAADFSGADPDASGDLAVSPAVSLGGGKASKSGNLGNLGNPSKKAFGGARTMSAGGGGGSKFGGFRKGGGVTSFSGGKR